MSFRFEKQTIRNFIVLSLLGVLGVFSVSMPSQAKSVCHRPSFNGSAGVSFIDQACLARQAKKHRQRFAAVSAKKKRKRLTKAQKRKIMKRKRKKRLTSSRRKQSKNIVLLQKLLAEQNHTIGKPNGRLGDKTKKAMAAYAQKYNIQRATSVHAVLKHLLAQKSQSIPLPTAAPKIAALSAKPSKPTPPKTVAALVSQPFRPSHERGEKYARQCLGCHSFKASEGHKAGPNLHGVMGQFIGSANEFNYSETLKFQMTMGNTWSKQELDCFLKDPQGCKPGTSMSFNGIKSANKRADLIAYLAQLGQ